MATPVEIVRPDKGFRESLGDFLYSLAVLAISAWIVMLLLPRVWKPLGYWDCVVGIWIIQTVIGDTAGHRIWTRDAR